MLAFDSSDMDIKSRIEFTYLNYMFTGPFIIIIIHYITQRYVLKSHTLNEKHSIVSDPLQNVHFLFTTIMYINKYYFHTIFSYLIFESINYCKENYKGQLYIV